MVVLEVVEEEVGVEVVEAAAGMVENHTCFYSSSLVSLFLRYLTTLTCPTL